jgi:uncharacterized membrane protein YraQ (UPF0718 family)
MVYAVLVKAGQSLLSLGPYVILGVLVGEALKLTSWTRFIYRFVSKSPFVSIMLAAIFGVVSPLCTYGTIPVVIQLFNGGIHIAPLATFLATSSLMNPQLFIMTWGGISPEMALIRAGAVLLFGLLLGLILYRVPESWIINPHLLNGRQNQPPVLPGQPHRFTWRKFLRNNFDTLQYIGFYIIIGIIIGAIIEVYVPGRWMAFLFKTDRWASIFLAALLGVPLYACGGGTIPLIRTLIQEGMSKGAALAFFMVGAATRVTPLTALATIIRPMFIVCYVVLLILFSVVIGGIYH